MPESAASEGVITVWRIATDTPDYTADDLSGTGAQRSGGRWNARGTPLVYTSTSRALACLETVVHLGATPVLPLNRYLVRVDIPVDLWAQRIIFDAAQHIGWDAIPAARVSIAWGGAWAQQGSCLAEVPSVIVPEESNLLINPRHMDAARITARKVRRWLYDPRTRLI